MTIVMWIRVPS